MESEVIRKKLEARFAAPLPDFYKRRIIFWHDEDQSFKEMIDEFVIPVCSLISLTKSFPLLATDPFNLYNSITSSCDRALL